jgi:hypothetical protein
MHEGFVRIWQGATPIFGATTNIGGIVHGIFLFSAGSAGDCPARLMRGATYAQYW